MKRLRLAGSIVSVLLFSSVATRTLAAPPSSASTQQLYEAAMDAAKRHDYVRAIALCQQTLKTSPNAAPVWATLARLFSQTSHPKEAIAAGEKAVALSPRFAAFTADLSDFYLRGGFRTKAEATALKALVLDPKSDVALTTMATCRLAARRDKEAIPYLTRLQAVRGGKDRAIAQNLVAIYLRTGDKKSALATMKAFALRSPTDAEATLAVVELALKNEDRATTTTFIAKLEKLAPKSPLPAYYRGQLALSDRTKPLIEDLGQAEKSFQNAVNKVPEYAPFRAQLGFVQLGQGQQKFDRARTNLTAALLYDNHNVIARKGMARLDEEEKNWDDAAIQYQALLQVTPDDHTARRRYAGVLLLANRKDDAYRQFHELASRLPTNTVYLKELASLYIHDRSFSEARGVYALVLERNAEDTDALVGIAQCFSQEGKKREARDAYERAIKADAKNETAYLALAQLYIDDGNSDKDAIQILQTLLKNIPTSNAGRWQLIERYILAKRDTEAITEIQRLTLRQNDPNRNLYRLAMGNLYMAREKWAEAIQEFERIAQEEPDNPEILAALADAYAKAGRKLEADTEYEKAATMAESVLRVAPKNTDARRVLLRVRTLQNKADTAQAFFQQLDARQ